MISIKNKNDREERYVAVQNRPIAGFLQAHGLARFSCGWARHLLFVIAAPAAGRLIGGRASKADPAPAPIRSCRPACRLTFALAMGCIAVGYRAGRPLHAGPAARLSARCRRARRSRSPTPGASSLMAWLSLISMPGERRHLRLACLRGEAAGAQNAPEAGIHIERFMDVGWVQLSLYPADIAAVRARPAVRAGCDHARRDRGDGVMARDRQARRSAPPAPHDADRAGR